MLKEAKLGESYTFDPTPFGNFISCALIPLIPSLITSALHSCVLPLKKERKKANLKVILNKTKHLLLLNLPLHHMFICQS